MSQIFWTLGTTLQDMERQIIPEAMRLLNGDKEEVAKSLGMSTRNLYNKLNQYAKEREEREALEKQHADKREAEAAHWRGLAPTMEKMATTETAEPMQNPKVAVPTHAKKR